MVLVRGAGQEDSTRRDSVVTLWFLAACAGLVVVVVYGSSVAYGYLPIPDKMNLLFIRVLSPLAGFQFICWAGFGISSRNRGLPYRIIVPIFMSFLFIALGAVLFVLSLAQGWFGLGGQHLTIG